MSNFNLNDYEPVDVRIKKFYEKYPEGRILTEVEKISDDFSMVLVKAYIHNNDTMVASGYAQETKDHGFVNKDCWIENAETSAIGRALANYGFSGDKRPSREEMQKVQKKIVSPDGNYESAIKYLNSCDELEKVVEFIEMLDAKTWKQGEKEKLLMFAAERKGNLSTGVDKIVDMFNGEVVDGGEV